MSGKSNNSRVVVILAWSAAVLLAVGACSETSTTALTDSEMDRLVLTHQKIDLVRAQGGLAVVVGGETITSDEIVKSPMEIGGTFILPIQHFSQLAKLSSLEQFKDRARRQMEDIIAGRISGHLLYQMARNQFGEHVDETLDKAVETEMRRFVLQFGGDDAKADQALEAMGMDRKSFKEYKNRSLLTEYYISTKFPDTRPITHSEMIDFYNKVRDEAFAVSSSLKFRLIDIHPEAMQAADPNADELLARIKQGQDFAELARQYSHGSKKALGGLWELQDPDSLVRPYDVLARQGRTLKPGDIAGPIEAPGHIFIMKLEEMQTGGYRPFEQVQSEVQEMIFADRRDKVMTKLNDRLMRHAALGIKDEFVDFCLERMYELSMQ